jgi:hypothetical protein
LLGVDLLGVDLDDNAAMRLAADDRFGSRPEPSKHHRGSALPIPSKTAQLSRLMLVLLVDPAASDPTNDLCGDRSIRRRRTTAPQQR